LALDLTTALNQYGFVGDLANSVPELKGIFAQAAREEWDPARFQRAVMDSGWWKSMPESARFLATQSVTDPSTYAQSLNNAASKIRIIAEQMGRGGGDWFALARESLINNYDDDQVRWLVSMRVAGTPFQDGVPTGQAGQIQGHLKQVAGNYGVPVTDKWISDALIRIQAGIDSLDGYENVLRARAKAAFPQFADQIDTGMTVRDIADPYISTMANTLEVSETELDLNDQSVRRALSQKQPDGTMGSMPLWEFERSLKDDARWDKTKQARTQAFETIAQVGRDFGFEA
jgi:hypothetical protein